MGGYGSGRGWYEKTKATVENLRTIDVRRWQRDGLLSPNQSFRWQWSLNNNVEATINVKTDHDIVHLTYRHKSRNTEWQDELVSISIDWTKCNFGGKRPWFICPTDNCHRRVAKLYGGALFLCRHCHNLAYTSQREKNYDRSARRANKIREKLGWDTGIFNSIGGRPKGMHWKTYFKLTNRYERLVSKSLKGIREEFLIPPRE